jgi:predicted aconitase with swiveling domain
VSGPPTWTADGRALVDGTARGRALVLDEALSFWGGLDPRSGTIIDVRHPQHGLSIAGAALVMPAGRGSSSSSTVLAEAIRAGTGPALICLGEADEVVVLGALVVQMLDGATVPVVVVSGDDYRRMRSGDSVTVRSGGRVEVAP